MFYTEFLRELKSCPFCDLKERSVSENQSAFLTYALAPYHTHHMLVVPRRHVVSFLEMAQDEIKDTWSLIQRGGSILERLGYKNYSVLIRNGHGGGRSVEHAHFHIVPEVSLGDIDHKGEKRKVMGSDEIKVIFEQLKNADKDI